MDWALEIQRSVSAGPRFGIITSLTEETSVQAIQKDTKGGLPCATYSHHVTHQMLKLLENQN